MSTPGAVSTDVIIIGGGIAGLKAALTLQDNDIPYILLEAQDRLGGRLKTVKGQNGKYDIGASWFHETLNNALFDEENTLDDGKGPKWFYDDAPIRVIDQHGEVSPMLKLGSISNEIVRYVEMECYKNLDTDMSFHDTMVQYLTERKHLLSDEQISRAIEYVRSLELWHGVDVQRLSAKYSPIDHEGRDALALNYDRVLARHVNRLDNSSFKLSTPITSIERLNHGRNVRVTAKNGTLYEAKYCIVTVPQSVLQIPQGETGHISFTPSLPKPIRDSLKTMHFGALGKVILEFDETFWPTDHERVLALASAPKGFLEAIKNGTEVPKISGSVPQTWQYPILALNFATSFSKPSLVVLTQSPVTDFLEANTDKAWPYLKPIIQTMAKKTEIPTPSNVIVSDWTQNEFQRGSYTACYPGDDPAACVIAFESGFGNVRFAGEHTVLEGAGCVHGAWNSGKREANYIIEHIKTGYTGLNFG
ncbi:Polyamine oxidase FMS1 [Cyberlindnera fabianii]|uniref:Amine oxidase n=1 Tax=Cyberlindnera fabianii TaxID=36022 RepID=A0A1V2L9W1_CYBFA|nr:Polyamine oxidase FMS1 [Cyberlindnera fabianii]